MEGEKYYFREIDIEVQCLRCSSEIRSGKYRHVFLNKTVFSFTVHVKSDATTKKKELSLSGCALQNCSVLDTETSPVGSPRVGI